METVAAETPFHAQRRKMRELKVKQDSGEVGEQVDAHISKKAAARRAAEKAAKPVTKKKSKKKTVTTE